MAEYNVYNEDCMLTMDRLINEGKKVSLVLSSPPYNTEKTEKEQGKEGFVRDLHLRYDMYRTQRTTDEFCDWMVDIFNHFDKIVEENGVVLWNMSYGVNADVDGSADTMWLTIADIIRKTPFMVADRIIWKKKSAWPVQSKNKLTRIVEDVFVFCRKNEFKTFNMNKRQVSISKHGVPFYENKFNFVEARNNDGLCDLNKATYSSELCEKLLDMYAKRGDTIYDPFNGTGTTGVAAKKLGMSYIGSEISPKQVEYSINRIEETQINAVSMFEAVLEIDDKRVEQDNFFNLI